MRLAIAGSRSLLGRALRRRAAAAGWRVAMVGAGPDADIAFDVKAPRAIDAELAGFDALVICTAAFAPDTLTGMRENLQVNVLGALALLDEAVRAGMGQLVFVSSTSAVRGEDAYGRSKAMAEAMLSELAPPGLRLAIVRPAQIYDSEGEAAKHQPFLYFLIDRISAGEDVTLYGRKDVLRNYVHVDDVAEALFGCVREGLAGAFNAVHPESLRVSEVAAAVQAAFGGPSRARFDADKPDMAEVAIPQADNLFARLGLTPRPLGDGLQAIRARRASAVPAAT